MSDLREIFSGYIWEFPAVVDRVYDGDSVFCHILIYAGMELHDVNVRVEGINAIELRQKFGGEARDALADLLPVGTQVILRHRKSDKYSGRFLAVPIRMQDGVNVASEMLTCVASDGETPLATPYNP